MTGDYFKEYIEEYTEENVESRLWKSSRLPAFCLPVYRFLCDQSFFLNIRNAV